MFIDLFVDLQPSGVKPGIWEEIINTDYVRSIRFDFGCLEIYFADGSTRTFRYEINRENNRMFKNLYLKLTETIRKGEDCKLVLYP